MSKFKRDYFCDYEAIRAKVLKRDNHTCQFCNKKRKRLNLHHIRKWSSNKMLRYDEDNLICLCIGCHRQIKNKEEHFAQLFTTIVWQNKSKQK